MEMFKAFTQQKKNKNKYQNSLKGREKNTSRICVSLVKMICRAVLWRNGTDMYKKTTIIGYLYSIPSVLEQDTGVWCKQFGLANWAVNMSYWT